MFPVFRLAISKICPEMPYIWVLNIILFSMWEDDFQLLIANAFFRYKGSENIHSTSFVCTQSRPFIIQRSKSSNLPTKTTGWQLTVENIRWHVFLQASCITSSYCMCLGYDQGEKLPCFHWRVSRQEVTRTVKVPLGIQQNISMSPALAKISWPQGYGLVGVDSMCVFSEPNVDRWCFVLYSFLVYSSFCYL